MRKSELLWRPQCDSGQPSNPTFLPRPQILPRARKPQGLLDETVLYPRGSLLQIFETPLTGGSTALGPSSFLISIPDRTSCSLHACFFSNGHLTIYRLKCHGLTSFSQSRPLVLLYQTSLLKVHMEVLNKQMSPLRPREPHNCAHLRKSFDFA